MKFLILQEFGYESRHNTDCWSQKEYIGVGLSAHSYINRTRYSNTCNYDEYINNIKNSEFGKNIEIHEVQNDFEMRKGIYVVRVKKIARCKYKWI